MDILITGDGSHTLLNEKLSEPYHSTFGAITESEHVFIRNGLDFCKNNPVHILEMGFGTGLNALLTCLQARQRGIEVVYTALEKFPVERAIATALNYPARMARHPDAHRIFSAMHDARWEKQEEIVPGFRLLKCQVDIIQYPFNQPVDLVYYDAFSPQIQPALWVSGLFLKIFKSLQPGGFLVTYCAKGDVRRNLEQAGFKVLRLQGPPGKREMLRAEKTSKIPK